MTEERIDAELLAAFLDGTASDEERSSVLELAARSRAAYEQLVGAARVHAELANEPVDAAPVAGAPAPDTDATTVRPLARHGRGSRSPWRFAAPLLVAAGLAAIVLTTLTTRDGGEAARGALQLAESLRLTTATGSGAVARVAGADWSAPRWPVMRGDVVTPRPSALAFRSGVRLAALVIAATVADTQAIGEMQSDLLDLLRGMPASSPVSATIERLPAPQLATDPAARTALAREVRTFVGDEPWFELGAWCEAVRLSIAAGDGTVLDSRGRAIPELRALLARGDGEEWREATRPLTPIAAGSEGSRPDPRAVREAIDAVIRAAGR